jgi:uncharacterized alkaline shock family protein YloU
LSEKSSAEKVPNEVIAVCAMNAVRQTDGVSDMAAGLSESLSKNILGRDPLAKGIRISEEKDGLVIDVFVNVRYNTKIPIVAWDIQENVKRKVEEITEMPIQRVNIHVQGVGFDTSDTREEQT